ncbi:hypothetical protein Lal_00047271 [Lupinus albus]|nr:hypothetical protein Lal_00047271 [Lupinus albus]
MRSHKIFRRTAPMINIKLPLELNEKLEIWRETLEARDFIISRSKTMYMEYKFSKRWANPIVKVNIGHHTIPQFTRFSG